MIVLVANEARGDGGGVTRSVEGGLIEEVVVVVVVLAVLVLQ